MIAGEINKFPALVWDYRKQLHLVYGFRSASKTMSADEWFAGQWLTDGMPAGDEVRHFNPMNEQLPSGCVLPEEFKHLAETHK